MRLAERHAQRAHQPVGEIGGCGIARAGARPSCARGPGVRSRDHAGHRGEAQRQRLQGVEDRLPCPPACPWNRRAAGPSSRSAAPSSAPIMRPVLPRTSSAASGLRFCGMIEEPVVNSSDRPDEAELRRRPEHDFLGEARQMHRRDRRGGQRFEHEIAVGDAVERIGGRAVEAERLRGHVRDRSETTCPRARRRRAGIRSAARARRETAAIAAEHLDIGEQVMAEGHRLRRLQMGEAGHQGVGMASAPPPAPSADRPIDASIASMASRTHSRKSMRHLVVARAGGMQPSRRRRRSIPPAGFDVHVDVFERAREDEFSASISRATSSKPLAMASASAC